jgi:protein-disulfide isomerase
MKRALPFLIIIFALAAVLLMARYLKDPNPPLPILSPSVSPVASVEQKQGEPGAEPAHAQGNQDAPVTLEEFGDFECPPCGMLHPILKQIESDYGPAKVRLIFREYPLVPAHPHALAAARAAEAAGLQGRFWEMHHMLYDNQAQWHEAFDVRSIFEGYATKIGLDLNQFRNDQTGEIVERRIFLDGKRAHSLGVQGTPTVFINGREIPFESLQPDKFKALIDAELAAVHP